MTSPSKKPAILVLLSGKGTNLQAIIDNVEHGFIDAEIAAVISNTPNVRGLERARAHHIPAIVIDHRDFDNREAFDNALQKKIDHYKPALIVLAGFMRIFTNRFTDHYQSRMINIHPSLLPKYKGLDTHARALAAGDPNHGCSVHLVTSELDGGPIIAQDSTPILASDTVDTLAERIQKIEHRILPLCVKLLLEGIIVPGPGGLTLNGKPLPACGIPLEQLESTYGHACQS